MPRFLGGVRHELPPVHGDGFDRGRQSCRSLPLHGRGKSCGFRQADRPSPPVSTRQKYRGKSTAVPGAFAPFKIRPHFFRDNNLLVIRVG